MSNNLASDINFSEEKPTVRPVQAAPTSILGAVGVTERGPLFTPILCSSWDEFQRIFGRHTVNSQAVLPIQGFFGEGGTELHFVRIAHCTTPSDPSTKTSAKGTLDLLTGAVAASAGAVLSANTAPFDLEPGDTVIVTIDGGAPATATFNATAAARESAAGPYVMTNGMTLTVAIDGGAAQPPITFNTANFVSIGAATPAEVAAVINASLVGGRATVTSGGTKVTITSDKRGTGSGVNVTGGTANAVLVFTTGALAGTGNVANIDAVTSAEAVTVIGGAVAGSSVTNPGGAVRIASATTGGSSTVLVGASSSADDEFGFDNATHTGGTGAAAETLTVNAKSDGTYADGIRVLVSAATNGDADHFTLRVEQDGTVAETWPNLNMDPASPDYALTRINDENEGSNLIALEDLELGLVPASGTFGPLVGGGDGLVGLDDNDYIGGASVNGSTGLRALDLATEIALLAAPGQSTASVQAAMVTYCEITRRGKVFPIFDPPANLTAVQMREYFRSSTLKNLSEFGAIYWPRIKIDNPNKAVYGSAPLLTVPPSGAIAGLYARVDAAKPSGVFTHPAGVEEGRLRTARGVEMAEVKLKEKRDIVFPEGINPITVQANTGGVYLDGARTTKSDGNFPTIGERRGVIFLETSLGAALDFMRHKNINPRLYAAGERSTFVFLLQQTNNEAFASNKASEAFTVDFGAGINRPSTKLARTVNARISVATAKPAEFINIIVSPDTRALDEELAQAA